MEGEGTLLVELSPERRTGEAPIRYILSLRDRSVDMGNKVEVRNYWNGRQINKKTSDNSKIFQMKDDEV